MTNIARRMVGRWGMSEAIGPVSVLPGPADEPLLFPGQGGGVSPRTQELLDTEVRSIVDACYEEAVRDLRANRDKLAALAEALLEHETLDEADAYRVGRDRPGAGRSLRKWGLLGAPRAPPALTFLPLGADEGATDQSRMEAEMLFKRGKRTMAVTAAALVVGAATYALTASNTVPSTAAGSGATTITGFTATGVNYTWIHRSGARERVGAAFLGA